MYYLLVGIQFGCEKTRDLDNFGAGDTHEECDGVEHITKDKLQSELMDTETAADPGEQTVDGVYESKDGKYVGSCT